MFATMIKELDSDQIKILISISRNKTNSVEEKDPELYSQ